MLSFATVLIASLYLVPPVAADLVSPYGGETAPNFAEISVERDKVRVVLEIDLNAYPAFVAPDDGSGASFMERTGLTFTVNADGRLLERRVRTVDVRPRVIRQTSTNLAVPPRPRSDDVVYVEMEFMFEGKPERITFSPPLGADGVSLASIGVLAEHLGVPVTDYRYLSRPETMVPDWDDPWFTKFENPNLTRHHKSPLMSFLAVEPREVRHEVIVRLRDVEAWTGIALGGVPALNAEQMEHIKGEAAQFFAGKNPLTIDGDMVAPASVDVSQITVGADGLMVLDAPSKTDRGTALLGIILSYPRDTMAQNIEVNWELYPDGVETVPVTLTDPAGSIPAQAHRDASAVIWNNRLVRWQDPQTQSIEVKTSTMISLPIWSIGLVLAAMLAALVARRIQGARRLAAGTVSAAAIAGAIFALPVTQPFALPVRGIPDDVAARTIMSGVLTNISAAMLEVEPAEFAAALAPFVEDTYRKEVAIELRRGLSVALPSGALARVDEIVELKIENVSPDITGADSQVLAGWTSNVSGGHWGHMHRRQMTYRGLFDIKRSGSTWRLTGITILSAQTRA